ncbi:MAG TPA: S8 family peptidase [Thermoanaerobaculia bacterium]|nr:S8 family peptidase [Thermoanaerobaculia bacterium]
MNSKIERKGLWLLLLILFLGTAGSAAADFRPTRGPKAEGQYLVVFKNEFPAREAAHELAASHGGRADRTWTVVNGALFTHMNEAQARALAKNPKVAWVEEDTVMTGSVIQENATWGLDRIDQQALPLSTTYEYNFTGPNVHVYVLDSGIRDTHTEFGGRAVREADFINDGQNGVDCNGHGTHVAGTIAGATSGVAKSVRLHSVRVLNCNNQSVSSSVLDGINWVRNNVRLPAVVNMSLGGATNSTLDTAVNNAVAAGIFFAVSAGNNGVDACNQSPARAAGAFAVAATDNTDTRANFSNFGSCVKMFAPGVGIVSAGIASDTATATMNGTSMATPHVSGVAALILAEDNNLSPANVRDRLIDRATNNVVTNPGAGSPNRLLYSLVPAVNGVPDPPLYLLVVPWMCYGNYDLLWSSSDGATYYELYQSTSSSFTTQTRIYQGMERYSYVNIGATRYYRVRACNAWGCSGYTNGNRSATYVNGCF